MRRDSRWISTPTCLSLKGAHGIGAPFSARVPRYSFTASHCRVTFSVLCAESRVWRSADAVCRGSHPTLYVQQQYVGPKFAALYCGYTYKTSVAVPVF